MVNKEQLTKDIQTVIIDALLNSSLNISFIPDETERQIYQMIFDEIENHINDKKCLWQWIYSKKSN